jgi:hypothetical protein
MTEHQESYLPTPSQSFEQHKKRAMKKSEKTGIEPGYRTQCLRPMSSFLDLNPGSDVACGQPLLLSSISNVCGRLASAISRLVCGKQPDLNPEPLTHIVYVHKLDQKQRSLRVRRKVYCRHTGPEIELANRLLHLIYIPCLRKIRLNVPRVYSQVLAECLLTILVLPVLGTSAVGRFVLRGTVSKKQRETPSSTQRGEQKRSQGWANLSLGRSRRAPLRSRAANSGCAKPLLNTFVSFWTRMTMCEPTTSHVEAC